MGYTAVRGYLIYRDSQIERLQGAADAPRFVDECIRTGLPSEYFVDSKATGPLASFDMTETWVEHPYRNGIALVGDAAGSSDPTWGQGLSITTRDVRLLSENLLDGADWDLVCNRYAAARTDYFLKLIRVHGWIFDLFLGEGQHAEKRRERALPLLAVQPDRMPDHNFSGPDLPIDEVVRQRFLGEI